MTKVFQFSLQKVLNLREIIEESRATALKNSQVLLKEEQEKLEKLEKRKDSQMERKEGDGSKHVTLSLKNLQVSMDYISQLNDMISSQIKHVQKSNKLVDEDRNELVEASKNRKVVEKLREHHLANYAKNQHKREVKKESEIALQVSRRNSNDSNGSEGNR